MNKFILFLFLVIGFQSCADDSERELEAPDYHIDSVESNSMLPEGKSKIVVRVVNSNFSDQDNILYGYGDKSLEAKLNSEKSFQFKLNSGKHIFQFYAANHIGYEEITTLPIKVKPQTTTYISVDFKYVLDEPGVVKKPVIYLYPEEETEVSVSVQPKGEMSFTYPEYNGKWECTASPSGEIQIGEDSYNYLFWESEQVADRKMLIGGSLVSKENLLTYLEGALDKFGFNSKEKTDFITFWAPQMLRYETTNVRFILNEECNQFADLAIKPAPDNLIRFYMIWQPMHGEFSGESTMPEIPTSDRSGFTVLEWGGMEVPLRKNYRIAKK